MRIDAYVQEMLGWTISISSEWSQVPTTMPDKPSVMTGYLRESVRFSNKTRSIPDATESIM